MAQLPRDDDGVIVNHGKTLRIILSTALVALVAFVPAAQAQQQQQPSTTGVYVCNQATHTSQSSTGKLVADDVNTGSAAIKYTDQLVAKPGKGAGLANAATHSVALSACSEPKQPVVVVPPTGGGDPFVPIDMSTQS